MTKFRNILWGIVIIFAGIAIGLNTLDIVRINLFFDGWWTLFIIVPCFIDLFSKGKKTGNIIGIIIGVLLLLGAQGILRFDTLVKLMIPIILIIIGLSIIFRDVGKKKIGKKIEELKKKNKNDNATNEYTSVFSGQDINFDGELFRGATLCTSFGGINCDLRHAFFDGDTLIKCEAVFGGIDIFVPKDVKVKVRSSSAFGGVSNKTEFDGDENAPTLYIDATCVFGGVDIKC